MRILVGTLLLIAALCSGNVRAQQVETSLPISQRLSINLAAGVPEYVGDASSTSNAPQSQWWFENTSNSTAYSTPGFVEGSGWQQIGLPYDANIPRTFINQASGGGQGSLTGQENWYRLHFKVDPKYAGQKFMLNIEGSHTGVQVFINGTLLKGISAVAADAQATHVVGFIPVIVDLTPYIHADGTSDNVIAIDVSRGDPWFEQPAFSGAFRFGQAMAGLFRNVYLYITNPVHIPVNSYSNQATWGTYVGTVSEVPAAEGTATAASAVVEVQTNVLNEMTTAQPVTLTTQIVDANGNVVVTAPPITQSVPPMTPGNFPSGPTPIFDQMITVPNPTLWYPNNSIYGKPYMYKVYHIVSVNGVVVDAAQSPLGIRTLTWDANFPYFNGHAMYLWGGSSRYDYPALGSSVPDEQWWRDMAQIAAQGGNVWRVGHSTSSEELVEAADAYGIMIDQPSGDGEGYWNNPSADDTQLKLELHRDMIIRDRSHPSILDWEEDNGGMNQPLADQLATLETQWDNINPRVQADRTYKPSYADMDECDGAGCEAGNKEQNEGNPAFGAEYWDNMGTGRGLAWDYELAFAAPYLNDWRQGRAANAFGMAQWYFADSPGEISLYAEYQNQPNMNNFVRSLGYSSVDMNRFPRLLYYIYQANWVPYSIQPVVHLGHHWNRAYEYTPGTPIQENAFSNCPSVRLLINGVAKDPVTGAALADQTPNPWNIGSNADLTQNTTVMPGQVHWMVNWAPGSVTAECIDDYGNVVSGVSDTRTTAGPENKIVLSVVPEVTRPDGTSFQWTANGSDAAFIQAQVQDANGNLVPTAADNVTFTVTGPGTYMGGSQQLVADPSWTTYYQDAFSQANSTVIGGLPYAFFHSPGDPELNFEGGLQKIALRSTFAPGTVTVTATAPGLASGSVQLTSVTPPAPTQNQPPAIIVPPVNTATTVGYPATFTVAASGSGTLTYQWYLNNSEVNGATGTTYTTPPTTLSENGQAVAVTITNAFGTTTSTPVVLTVDAAANVAITTQPASQTAVVGQLATLTVAATGSPAINYAWYENGTQVQSGPQASYTTPILTATGTDTFYVIVSNPSSQVQSSNAVLTINAPTPVSITSQPASQIVAANLPVLLTAVVGGSAPYTYQWQFTPTGGSPTILVSNSQTSNTISYSIPAMSSANVGSYTVTVNNAANAAVTSAAATLTLAPPGLNLALDKVATSSSTQNACTNATTTPPYSGVQCLGPENAVDGSLTTRWGSATAGAPPTSPVPGVDPSWLQVDLGSVLGFNTVIINWENAYAAQYQIQYTSEDPATNPTWNVAYTNTSGTGGTETLNFPTVQARYIRMYGTQRATQYGYSIYEFQVYNVQQCGGPNERYTVNSSNSSLVLDNLSGLTWTRTIETDTAAGSQFTGASATAYCSSINMRLPTQAEALGISGNNDAACAVVGTWSTWTSTVDPNDASETAIVNFDGTSTWNVTNNYPGATLCVEGAAGTPPTITSQPASQTVALGQTATFSVVASGAATLGYQWYKNGAVVANGNAATYTTPATVATDNGAAFTVAVSDAGETVLSNSATLTVTGISCTSAPSVPGSVTASATSSSQISLTWGASAAGSNCSIGYNLYRSTVPGFTPGAGNQVATSQTSTAFADAGLTPSTTYYYVVEAVDGYGMSAASNQASATTLASGSGSGPTFTVGVSTPSLTVTVGISGTEIITLTPENGFSSTSPITFACSGLPTGAACAFSPVTVSQAGNMVSTLTITTTTQSAAVRSRFGQWFGGAALAVMFVFVGRKKRRSVQLMLLLMALCFAGLSVTGCGVNTAAQQTNSKVTVTATSGSLQQTTTFSLTVVSSNSSNASALHSFPSQPWLPCTALAGVLCFFRRKTRYALRYMLLFASLIGISFVTGCGNPNAVDDHVKPRITTQPASGTATIGQTASFSVVATGTAPLTYQWYNNGTAIPGATAANYTTPALTMQNNGANYDVVVTNTVGSVTSSNAGLTVTSGSVSCSVVPSVPGSVVASSTSSSQISISWSASSAGSPCSLTYNVYHSTISGFIPGASNQVASAQTAASFVDTGLTASTTYYYVVEAADAFGSSAPSTQVSAQTLAAGSPTPPASSCTTVPATPAGFTPTAASVSTVSLSWTADTAPENCSITYSVYGSTTSGFTPSASNLVASGITATSYTNTGLTASTSYYYVVEAVDTDGSSAPSAQVVDTTTAAASLSTEIVAIHSGGPAVSNATGGDASFVADEFYSGGTSSNFNGAVATSGIPNAAPEAVYQSERNGQFTYTIPGLAPNASYTVLLHFSENYFTTVGSRVFNVAINGTPVLTKFDIYAQAGANTALVEPFTATANQQGQLVIAYTTGSANFPKSSGLEVRGAASACTLLPTAAPTGLTAQATSPSIVNLNWATVTPPPNCAITYNVYGSTNSGFTPSASNLLASGLTNTAYSNTGLAASTTYYYVVEAVDGGGASGPSAQASAETNSATSCIAIPSVAPASFFATALSSTAISLNWTAIPAPANCTNITYNIYASTTSGFTPAPTNEIAVNLPNTTFVNNNLPALSTYYYVVQAVDEDGVSSEFSVPASETTFPPPSQLTATAISANEIDLTFPESTAPAPVQYNVFRSTTENFTPSGSNQVGSSKSNFYHDVVLNASTTYYYIVHANSPGGTTTVGGSVNATTLSLGNAPPFWDASNIPATPAGDVMTFKFLNRTNGQYPDDQVYWSVTVNGVTTTNTIAAQPYFNMPANASGRMYFYLGSVGQNNNNYYDFIEYTIGPTFFNGDTTRVDAFGVKLAFQLTCGDGTDIAVGENAATFAENRATTFQRYLNAVPPNFQTLAQINAPYQIIAPGGGGFDTGGPYDTYYNAWIDQIWANNGITSPARSTVGDNGDGLGSYPNLSAAIYRHVGGTAGSFNANGTLANAGLWGNPNTFYQQAPASYYAQFFHANAINGQQYTFPYDDAGGYSSDVGCGSPNTLLVAVGW